MIIPVFLARRPPTQARWGLVLSMMFLLSVVEAVKASPPSEKEAKPGAKNGGKPSSGRIMTLAESIKSTLRSLDDPEVEKIRRQYWKKTLEDIRTLSFGMSDKDPFLSQWKQVLEEESNTDATEQQQGSLRGSTSPGDDTQADNTTVAFAYSASRNPFSLNPARPRFEGFPNWERMLQEWSDEVQEYMQKVEKEAGTEYMLANYGRSPSMKNNGTSVDALETEAAESEMPVAQVQPYASYIPDDIMVEQETQQQSSRRSKSIVPAPPKNGEPVLPHTDLSDKSKKIEIVTTASLPWKTGTAVNPLLRAAYMCEGRKEAGGSVSLSLPWLERRVDQEVIYGPDNVFETKEDQEAYIRTWLRESAGMQQASDELKIRWYTAWQNPAENSIYSMGDITALIPADEVDICILEEPEHLNWYRAPGESWTRKFKHVVGILHTNYFQYALDQPAAIIRAPAMRLLCSWMCRAHCHRIIKLSGTIDKVAPEKELVENVHGVRGTFLEVGKEVGRRIKESNDDPIFGTAAQPTIYFIGKMLWSKGLSSLMELLKYAEESADIKVKVDMYGGGPDLKAAKAKADSLGLDMPFHGPLDHAEVDFTHKIFVNPSTSEVLCTTSAEALAMGKFLILPSHVSNDFFAQFPNCLSYASKEEFVGNLFYAMTHAPEPLSDKYLDALSWKAATQRLEAAGCIPVAEAEKMEQLYSSKEGGVEIPLPPLIEDEKRLKQISTTFRYTRHRFRQFRSRLSTEIMQNKVLPKKLRERLAADFERKLDLDIDEILESPKLRLQLSPAELDKSLLDLYESVTKGASGDVLRLIGGGGAVGMQNMYMKRQAMKERSSKGGVGRNDLFPFELGNFYTDEGDQSASQWIRQALRRNLPTMTKENGTRLASFGTPLRQKQLGPSKSEKVKETPKMSAAWGMPRQQCYPVLSSWTGLAPPQTSRSLGYRSFSLLI